jgi:hypothetical protein
MDQKNAVIDPEQIRILRRELVRQLVATFCWPIADGHPQYGGVRTSGGSWIGVTEGRRHRRSRMGNQPPIPGLRQNSSVQAGYSQRKPPRSENSGQEKGFPENLPKKQSKQAGPGDPETGTRRPQRARMGCFGRKGGMSPLMVKKRSSDESPTEGRYLPVGMPWQVLMQGNPFR